MSEYVVIIEKGTDSWGAYSPDLNVYATAASCRAVERRVREAIDFHVDTLREEHLPIPEPTARAITVDV